MKTKTKPREHGLAFSREMVDAILAGTKTQTRRPLTWKPREPGLNLRFAGFDLGYYFTDRPDSGFVLRSRGPGGCWNDRTYPLKPDWQVGDLLWVKEPLRVTGRSANGFRVSAVGEKGGGRFFYWHETTHKVPKEGRSFGQAMPKRLARIWLEVVEVKPERLQSISFNSALAEGLSISETDRGVDFRDPNRRFMLGSPVRSFFDLWDRLYGKGEFAWKEKPWVWVIKFKLHERSVLA